MEATLTELKKGNKIKESLTEYETGTDKLI